ncbi:hypothetical protein UCDDA912_g06290 [Diaporthe ampelina]|uniref:Apple domain-containing protein n=1 Tax=Diaporthe ampelina TaxID=1214573 RepID=A0A0G2FHY1_9PEZI|nr:hypothetical protein UCDDA912_g06290 [Diaporthe ampelina]
MKVCSSPDQITRLMRPSYTAITMRHQRLPLKVRAALMRRVPHNLDSNLVGGDSFNELGIGIDQHFFTVEGEAFLVYCLTDFQTESSNIAQSLEPSISDCIGSCVTYNSENENTDSPCQGLTFGANLTRYRSANCFLKTGPLTKKPYTRDDFQAGAILLG